MLRIFAFIIAAGICSGFSPAVPSLRNTAGNARCPVAMQMQVSTQQVSSSRREAIAAIVGGAAWLANVNFANAIAGPDGLEYEVLASGQGPKPKIGDLVAIRFKVM